MEVDLCICGFYTAYIYYTELYIILVYLELHSKCYYNLQNYNYRHKMTIKRKFNGPNKDESHTTEILLFNTIKYSTQQCKLQLSGININN